MRLELMNCVVDLASRRVLRDGEPSTLTSREAALLDYLAARPGVDVSMEELHREVWGHSPGVISRAAFHTMRRLRHKLEQNPARPEHLLSVHGTGFRLVLAGKVSQGTPTTPTTPLPPERDGFFGRGSEIEQLRGVLARSRLVTVAGLGGMGKTRLAQHLMRDEIDGECFDGAWFCDLTAARDTGGIVGALADALGIEVQGGVEQLGHALAARGDALVVLDNFEQLVEYAQDTIGRWLDLAEGAHFVVTSRRVLSLPGEVIVELGGLPVPDDVPATLDEALANPAVAMLCERARAAVPTFDPGLDIEEIVALVRLLEGIPLAIELAASRLRVMSVHSMLSRMSDRFALLSSGGRGRPERHATLRAVLEWSVALLQPHEVAALGQLSVFEGGFTLEAAEAVLELSSFEGAPEALDVVASLSEHALVRRNARGRLGMLVTVQQFAREMLDDGERTATEARHGAWFAETCSDEALEALERRGDWSELMSQGPELANLEVATERAIARGDGKTAASLCLGVWRLYEHGRTALRPDLLDGSLAVAEPRQRARIHVALGRLSTLRHRPDASQAHHEAARVLARANGDRRCESEAITHLGSWLLLAGKPGAALERYEEALELIRGLEDRWDEPILLAFIARVHRRQDRGDEALAILLQGLATARTIANRHAECAIHSQLGLIFQDRGELERSREHLEEAISIALGIGYQRHEIAARRYLGNVLRELGAFDQAREQFEASLSLGRALGQKTSEGSTLIALGSLALSQDRLEEARRWLEEARRATTDAPGPEPGVVLEALEALAHRLGEAREPRTLLDRAEARSATPDTLGSLLDGAPTGSVPTAPDGPRSLARGRGVADWEVVDTLGRGGMGTVYAVRHPTRGRAALKILHVHCADLDARFAREGRLQATLRHENLVAVLELLTVDGLPALLLERVDGPDLATRLAKGPPLDTEHIDALVHGICNGIDAAHRAGIVHRDLKPANILLAGTDTHPVPKLTDFGLARLLQPDDAQKLTTTGIGMGTPGYMAPEQLRSAKTADERTDIFALGCICYELVAHRPAFDDEGRTLPIDEAAPTAPARWRDAIAAAMQHDPDRRPSSVDDFRRRWNGHTGTIDES